VSTRARAAEIQVEIILVATQVIQVETLVILAVFVLHLQFMLALEYRILFVDV
jgi:hypothetical protein